MSQIVVIVGGIPRTVTRVRAMAGGVLRDITRAIALSGVQRTVYLPGGTPTPPSTLAASAMPGSVSGNATSTNLKPRTVNTETAYVTATGGTGPYTYSWVLKSSDGANWMINNSTAQSTSFRVSLGPDTQSSAVFQCIVTDSAGASVATNDVTAYAEVYGG